MIQMSQPSVQKKYYFKTLIIYFYLICAHVVQMQPLYHGSDFFKSVPVNVP